MCSFHTCWVWRITEVIVRGEVLEFLLWLWDCWFLLMSHHSRVHRAEFSKNVIENSTKHFSVSKCTAAFIQVSAAQSASQLSDELQWTCSVPVRCYCKERSCAECLIYCLYWKLTDHYWILPVLFIILVCLCLPARAGLQHTHLLLQHSDTAPVAPMHCL